MSKSEQAPKILMAEVTRIAQKEIELTRDKQRISQELADVEAAAGLAYLEGGPPTLTDSTAKIRQQLSVIDSALRVCRSARLEAIRTKLKNEAAYFRRDAGHKQAELDTLLSETGPLLLKLSAFEDVTFTQELLSHQPAADPLQPNPIPKSTRLRAEIAALQRQAGDFECRTIPDSGTVNIEATGPEEVLLAILTHGSQSPSAQEVVDWVGSCQGAALKRRGAGAQFGDNPRRIGLVWKDGTIDLAQSYVFVRSLAPVIARNEDGTPRAFDIASATFHAEGYNFNPSAKVY